MNKLNKSLKLAKNTIGKILLASVFSLILGGFFINTKPVLASEETNNLNVILGLSADMVGNYEDSILRILNPEVMLFEKNRTSPNHLPENKEREVAYITKIVFTAYNSEVGQCDDTPCITANGFDVCKHDKEDTIAMNGIKFGTKIRIPELFGDRVFEVRDRMNARYGSNRADVWMKSKVAAKKFGVQMAKVEVLK